MLKAAPRALSVSQAADYHRKEYSAGDYYTGGNVEAPGWWSGAALQDLGIEAGASVSRETFLALLEGRHAQTGEQLIPDPPVGEHRAGWDFQCSPDKSISILALVGGDDRVTEAVKAANTKALAELERFAMGKDKERVRQTTGNLVIATFQHETSRKLDPQLHFHNVVMNMTRREDGKLVALETKEMYAAQAYGTGVFRAELAKSLQELGYEIEVAADGNVSIPSVGKDLCDWFSKRRREDIEPYMEKHGLVGPEAAQRAAYSTRKAKEHDVDEDELRDIWREISLEMGHDLEKLKREAVERSYGKPLNPGGPKPARDSVRWAMDHLSERKAIFLGRELYLEALKHGMGKITLDDLRDSISADRDLVHVADPGIPSGRMTTSEALKIESYNVKWMREGLDKSSSILPDGFKPAKPLSEGQKAVAEHILGSRDRVIAVEGKAGAGKTYTLEAVVSAAKDAGWDVRGFAPTSSAVKTLSEAGMECKTLAALGNEKDLIPGERQLWIVDEAGLMSSKAAQTLFQKAEQAGAKIVMVGDRLQHSAVESGKPFAYLQNAGLQPARLDEIQRQARPADAIHRALGAAMDGCWSDAISILEGRKGKPVPELEQVLVHAKAGELDKAFEILKARSAQAKALEIAVKEASEGHSKEAVDRLEAAGRIHQVEDARERHMAVARDFMATPKGQSCIVIAPSNAERRELNRLIREELIQAGTVERQSIRASIRASKGLTKAQKKEARSYEVGDFIRFTSKSKKFAIQKGDAGRVVSIDKEKNLVRVELSGGGIVEFDPARFGGGEPASVDDRRFAVGDRIQYREATTPEGSKIEVAGLRIANGDVGTIRSIDHETGQAVIQLEGSRVEVTLDLRRPQPIDHAYAMTSHVSQGRTEDRALVVVDTTHNQELVNREQFYVSTSRAALECVIYTDNKRALAQAVDRLTGKASALELKPEVIDEIETEVPGATLSLSGPEPGRELGTVGDAAAEPPALTQESVFGFANWPGDWDWWGGDVDLPGGALPAPEVGDPGLNRPAVGTLRPDISGGSPRPGGPLPGLQDGELNRQPLGERAGFGPEDLAKREVGVPTVAVGEAHQTPLPGGVPTTSDRVGVSDPSRSEGLESQEKPTRPSRGPEGCAGVDGSRRLEPTHLEPVGGSGSQLRPSESPEVAASSTPGRTHAEGEPVSPGWDSQRRDSGFGSDSGSANSVPSIGHREPGGPEQGSLSGLAPEVERLTLLMRAMGYEITVPGEGEEAEDVAVVIPRLVAAEWPDAPKPAKTTREALLSDLVAQPIGGSDLAEVAQTFQAATVEPRPEAPAEMQIRLPKSLPARGLELLASSWKRVQSLWGSRVPPVSESPKPVEPTKPGIIGLDTVPPTEVDSKPFAFVPDTSLPTGEMGWEPPENPGRPWPMGWPTPEEMQARRAAKTEAGKPGIPPVTIQKSQEPPPQVGYRRPKT